MSDETYLVICSCCGAQCGERDRSHGRCGNCGSFFVGSEKQIVDQQADDSVADGEQSQDAVAPTRPAHDSADSSPQSPSPSEIELDESGQSESEELVRPRRLSPQFRRHITMTWQPALADGSHGAQRTISSETSSEGTKHDSVWSRIGTRRVAPVQDSEGGDYQLQDVIGEGSMGRVWSARQTSLDRNVAVKVPRPELAGTGSVGEAQFISEVVVTGKLEHPNIVPIYELGRDTDGVPFYSMKHVQGRAWNEEISDKSEQENIEILMKVCDAIAFAHDRDFLHRDIKPHNVIVGQFGEVSVMDWGIAVSLSKDPSRGWAAVASGPAGTPAYMAPEMAAYNPSELGVVSDVYLLGAVLYEIVTGNPPHPCIGDTNEALLAAAANEIIPAQRNGELVDIARRAMATKPDDRYQSVKEFQDALREYQSHRQSIALAESADQHLATAKDKGISDEFARARFAYEEALRLWSGNSHASTGLRAATIAHAENALRQENYELGISILDRGNPKHRDLLRRLEGKRAAHARLVRVSKIAAAVAIAAILAVVIVVYNDLQNSRKYAKAIGQTNSDLTQSQRTLNKKNFELEEQKKTLEEQKAELAKTNGLLTVQRQRAMAAQRRERGSKIEAQAAERAAQEAAYTSDIGIAAESIRADRFEKAKSMLTQLASAPTDSVLSRLRHLEWGVLQYSATEMPVEDLDQQSRIRAVASSANGDVIAAGTEDGRVTVWFRSAEGQQAAGMQVEGRFGTRVNAIAISSDGRFLAVAGLDEGREVESEKFRIQLWNLENRSLAAVDQQFLKHSDEVLSLVFSPDADARYLLSSAADRTAVKWERATGQPVATIRDHLDRRVWSAQFDPQNHDRIVTACEDGRVRVWSTANDSVSKQADYRGHSGPVYAAVFSFDGQSVISGGYGRRLLHWNVADYQINRQVQNLDALLSAAREDDEQVQLVGNAADQHTASVRAIATYLLDGQQYLVSGGDDNTLRVWSAIADQQGESHSWNLVKTLRGHGRWIRDCQFSDSGATVVSGAYDGCKVWDWHKYTMPRKLYPNLQRRIGSEASEVGLTPATQAIYSRDGRWMATAYENGSVSVWDAQSKGRMQDALLGDGHAFLTTRGIFFDHSARLLTSAADNTTRLWDVARGTQVLKLEGTGWRGAAAVAWREQQQTAVIVTGSDDRLVPAHLWRVSGGKVVDQIPLLEGFARNTMQPGTLTSIGQWNEGDFDEFRRRKRQIPDVTAVAITPQGDRFLVGTTLGQCFLFHLDAGTNQVQQVAEFVGHGSSVRAAVFLPTGDSVITAGADGRLKQWDANDGSLQRELPMAAAITSLAVSASGERLLVGHSPARGAADPVARILTLATDPVSIERLELAGQSRDWTANPPTVQSVAFTENDERALMSLYFGTMQDSSTDATTPASSESRYELGYWDYRQAQAQAQGGQYQTMRTSIRGEISSAVLREVDGQDQLLVVGGKGARLLSQDGERAFTELTANFRAAAAVTAISFSYDPVTGQSHRLVSGDREGNIRVWEHADSAWRENADAAAQLAGHHQGQAIVAAEFDPQDPNRMLTVDANGKWIIWQYDAGPEKWSQVAGQQRNAVTHCGEFSPDGRRFLIGMNDHAEVWSRDSDEATFVPSRWDTGAVQIATFSDDGGWVITSDAREKIQFWDSSTGNLIAEHSDDDTQGLTALDLSWDRRRLVTGNQDNQIAIWNTSKLADQQSASGDKRRVAAPIRVLLTLERHERSVSSVAISPNGRDLLSADDSGVTILSSGVTVAPISITMQHQLSYDPNKGPIEIDPSLVISDPNHRADFSSAELRVIVTRDSSVDALPATDQDSEIRLPDGRLRLGDLDSTQSEGVEIRVALDESVDAGILQSMLRRLTYQISLPNSPATLTATSAAQPDMVERQTGDKRTMLIEITGIQYRDQSDEDVSVLRQTVEIEIESDRNIDSDELVLSEAEGTQQFVSQRDR